MLSCSHMSSAPVARARPAEIGHGSLLPCTEDGVLAQHADVISTLTLSTSRSSLRAPFLRASRWWSEDARRKRTGGFKNKSKFAGFRSRLGPTASDPC